MKKIVAVLLTVIMTISLAACGNGGIGVKTTEQIDDSKTTLYVGNYAGGVGDEWLKSAIEKFEEKYADTSFEDGKKGVQVIIGENNTTTMAGTDLIDLMGTTKTEIFFTQRVFYYEWVNKGLMYDLTDMVNETLTEYGEERSVYDKIYTELAEALTVDGKVYALPFWESYYGLVYNATMFDEYEWYFAEDGSFTDASGSLSAGPDGEKGTYDDGMPATYDEFFALCDQIADNNVTPVQWGSSDYFAWFLGALAADYMGYDELMLNYTFDGEATLVKPDSINMEDYTYETEKVAINQKNGYELARQEGLLQASIFAERFLQGDGYYDPGISLSPAYKISDAQLAFVKNAFSSSQKSVAMIIDGCWWENEADAAFRETYGKDATKHDNEMVMKWMPLPKATQAQIGSENVQVSPLDTYCFINAKIAEEKVEPAKLFLQFCHTDAMMEEFTKITGMFKPYNYEVDEADMTESEKALAEVRENSRVVYPMDYNDVYVSSAISLRLANLMQSRAEVGTAATTDIAALMTSKDGQEYKYDFKELFDGILEYRKTTLWPGIMSTIE